MELNDNISPEQAEANLLALFLRLLGLFCLLLLLLFSFPLVLLLLLGLGFLLLVLFALLLRSIPSPLAGRVACRCVPAGTQVRAVICKVGGDIREEKGLICLFVWIHISCSRTATTLPGVQQRKRLLH